MSYQDVRAAIVASLSDALRKAGYDPATVPDHVDVLTQGLIDSFGFLDLLEELEDKLGIPIDIAALDDEGLTTVGGLSRQLAAIRG